MCQFWVLRKKIPPILLLTTPLLSIYPKKTPPPSIQRPPPSLSLSRPTNSPSSEGFGSRMPFYGTLDEGIFEENFGVVILPGWLDNGEKRLENGQKNDREVVPERELPRRAIAQPRRYHAVVPARGNSGPLCCARSFPYLRSRPANFRRIWRVHTLQLRSSCVSFFLRGLSKRHWEGGYPQALASCRLLGRYL